MKLCSFSLEEGKLIKVFEITTGIYKIAAGVLFKVVNSLHTKGPRLRITCACTSSTKGKGKGADIEKDFV